MQHLLYLAIKVLQKLAFFYFVLICLLNLLHLFIPPNKSISNTSKTTVKCKHADKVDYWWETDQQQTKHSLQAFLDSICPSDEASVKVSIPPIPDRWAMFWSVLWAVHLTAWKGTP